MISRKMAQNFAKTTQAVLRGFHSAQYKSLFDIEPQVQRAIERGEPVVALESTIITHGMPHPQNLETAREVEELVRANGATPATIALLDGRIKVGLSAADLTNLAAKPLNEVIKCSRRDLPVVVAQRQSGGTTVAATTAIAHAVGLRIFATGGVGGVHREGHVTMDISADLVELGRTPMMVVCSGVKSILDIPRTLEYLETQGVCVVTYGNAEGRFPDFYTRDSGYRVPYNVPGPAEAARLIQALEDLNLQSGILLGVPIPEAHAADKHKIEAAIAQAYAEADHMGISGKQVTPFLLAAIAKITGGSSLQANMALIKNNATVAAQIARELCRSKAETSFPCTAATENEQLAPLIIGASILDLSLTMIDEMPTTLNGATYHTRAKQSAGGVGRNIAEGIFKLHGAANLISVVGDDQIGRSLLQLMPPMLRANVQVDSSRATSLCSVIFDRTGDCRLILGNMDIHERITPAVVQQQEERLRASPLIIMDSNLPVGTMECILQLAQKHKRPIFFEPTDMLIAAKPFSLPRSLTQQIKIISPNIFELKTIVEAMTQQPVAVAIDDPNTATTTQMLQSAKTMLAQIKDNFDCVLVTLGRHGALLSLRCDDNTRIFDPKNGAYIEPSPTATHLIRYYAVPCVCDVKNVSGAGDSFSSGFITGLLRGYEIERCVAMGFSAAQCALNSDSAVPEQYFDSAAQEDITVNNTLERLERQDL